MIQIVENVLDINLIQEIKDSVKNTEQIRVNYKSWGHYIVHSSAPVLIVDLNKDLTDKIKNTSKLNLKNSNIGAAYYGWTKLSYIPWHNDVGKKKAITIYVNDNWEDDWGGYFAYKDGIDIRCIKPEFNKAVILEGGIWHTVFSTNINAPMRETIQIFEFKEED